MSTVESETASDVISEHAGLSSLPAGDETFDAGVSSFVMCSVPDAISALTELHRVIRPGAELRFYDHVRAFHAPLGTLQDIANVLWPRIAAGCNRLERTHHRDGNVLWPRIAAGCNCNRETLSAILASGFDIRECRSFYFVPCPLTAPVDPLVLGRAVRR